MVYTYFVQHKFNQYSSQTVRLEPDYFMFPVLELAYPP